MSIYKVRIKDKGSVPDTESGISMEVLNAGVSKGVGVLKAGASKRVLDKSNPESRHLSTVTKCKQENLEKKR
jgi:hypothetical protein